MRLMDDPAHKQLTRQDSWSSIALNSPIMEGALTKLAVKSGRNWKKRHFILYPQALVYCQSKTSKAAKGVMMLSSNFYVGDATLRDKAFLVSDFNTTYNLAANTQQEKMDWMTAIARVIRGLAPCADDSDDDSDDDDDEEDEKVVAYEDGDEGVAAERSTAGAAVGADVFGFDSVRSSAGGVRGADGDGGQMIDDEGLCAEELEAAALVRAANDADRALEHARKQREQADDAYHAITSMQSGALDVAHIEEQTLAEARKQSAAIASAPVQGGSGRRRSRLPRVVRNSMDSHMASQSPRGSRASLSSSLSSAPINKRRQSVADQLDETRTASNASAARRASLLHEANVKSDAALDAENVLRAIEKEEQDEAELHLEEQVKHGEKEQERRNSIVDERKVALIAKKLKQNQANGGSGGGGGGRGGDGGGSIDKGAAVLAASAEAAAAVADAARGVREETKKAAEAATVAERAAVAEQEAREQEAAAIAKRKSQRVMAEEKHREAREAAEARETARALAERTIRDASEAVEAAVRAEAEAAQLANEQVELEKRNRSMEQEKAAAARRFEEAAAEEARALSAASELRRQASAAQVRAMNSPRAGKGNGKGRGKARNKLASMWEQKTNAHKEGQDANPFGEGGGKGIRKVGRGDAEYGKAKVGSKTAARAAAASEWVQVEMKKLCTVIDDKGEKTEEGLPTICFGPLFYTVSGVESVLGRAKWE